MAPLLTGLQRLGMPVVHGLCFPATTYVIPISSSAASEESGTCGASPLDLPLPLPAWALLALGQLRRKDGSPHGLSEEKHQFRCRFDHVSARGCVKVMPTQDNTEATTRFATWKAKITDCLPSINMLGIVLGPDLPTITVGCPTRDPSLDPDSGLRIGADLGTWSSTGVAMLEIRIRTKRRGNQLQALSLGGEDFQNALF